MNSQATNHQQLDQQLANLPLLTAGSRVRTMASSRAGDWVHTASRGNEC
jgi:hypothetical protein